LMMKMFFSSNCGMGIRQRVQLWERPRHVLLGRHPKAGRRDVVCLTAAVVKFVQIGSGEQ
jgi:hypothetical protein